MDLYLNKGKISVVIDKTHATVVPAFSDTPVTTELIIPWSLWECLEVGMDVVYAQFPDNTGVILGRMDGEWSHKLWQDPNSSNAVEAVTGDVKITAGDMITSVVPSYNGHIHTCPEGETSGPK